MDILITDFSTFLSLLFVAFLSPSTVAAVIAPSLSLSLFHSLPLQQPKEFLGTTNYFKLTLDFPNHLHTWKIVRIYAFIYYFFIRWNWILVFFDFFLAPPQSSEEWKQFGYEILSNHIEWNFHSNFQFYSFHFLWSNCIIFAIDTKDLGPRRKKFVVFLFFGINISEISLR